MKKKSIYTMDEIVALSPEELKRFIPDLIAFHAHANKQIELGNVSLETHGLVMNWTDDGDEGKLNYIHIIDQLT